MTKLSEMEKSALAEIGNISMGSSATALSNLLNQKVNITTPKVSCSTLEKVKRNYPVPCVVVEVEYVEGLAGSNVLIIKDKDAAIIANLMMGLDPHEEVKELNEIQISAVSESMNQMMGSASTALAEFFNMNINISPPTTEYLNLQNLEVEDQELSEDPLVEIEFRIEVGDLIDSQLFLLIPKNFAKDAAGKLLGEFDMPEEEGTEEGEGTAEEGEEEKIPSEDIQQVLGESSVQEETPVPGEEASFEGEKIQELTEAEIDALREVGNISMGAAATVLSDMLDKRVSITTPQFRLLTNMGAKEELSVPSVAVHVQYLDGFEGENILILKEEDSKIISGLMMGEELEQLEEELNEIQLSAVSEAMNQMMGSAATAMADLFNLPVQISPPGTFYKNLGKDPSGLEILENTSTNLIEISFHMEIGNLIDSNLVQLIPVSFGKKMAGQLLGGYSIMGGEVPSQEGVQEEAPLAPGGEAPSPLDQEGKEVPLSSGAEPVAGGGYQEEEIVPQSFMEAMEGDEKIDLIRDIPVKITSIMGNARMKLKNLVELGQGSVVELDRVEGEPVDILANGKLVGRGEVVVVDEHFGIRVTEIFKANSDFDEKQII